MWRNKCTNPSLDFNLAIILIEKNSIVASRHRKSVYETSNQIDFADTFDRLIPTELVQFRSNKVNDYNFNTTSWLKKFLLHFFEKIRYHKSQHIYIWVQLVPLCF